MGRGHKIIWDGGKEQFHDPEDDTFENSLYLEYYEYIDDAPKPLEGDENSVRGSDLATSGVLVAFESCKDTFSTTIGGCEAQFTVKKFRNEVHSVGSKVVYVYYDMDVHDNTVLLYKKILFGAHYNKQTKKLYLGMCWYQNPKDRSLILVLSLARTKCVDPRFDIVTWKRGDEKAVWQTNMMSLLKDHVLRIDIPVSRDHAMKLLVEAINSKRWIERLGPNLDESGNKDFPVPLSRTNYTPGQYSYNQLVAEPKSTSKRNAAVKAAKKMSQSAHTPKKKRQKATPSRNKAKRLSTEDDDAQDDEDIMDVDEPEIAPPKKTQHATATATINLADPPPTIRDDKRDEELLACKSQLSELTNLVKMLIAEKNAVPTPVVPTPVVVTSPAVPPQRAVSDTGLLANVPPHHYTARSDDRPAKPEYHQSHPQQYYSGYSSSDDDYGTTILRNMFVRGRQEEMDRQHELQRRNQMLEDAIIAMGEKMKRKNRDRAYF